MKYITFGEVMLRLKTPGCERLFQSNVLEATFGGGEANVAVSLANFGEDVDFVTVLPKNPLGDACIRELRGLNVRCPKNPERRRSYGSLFSGIRCKPASKQGDL